MEDAGLVVPEPGTPARRGAIALMDWVIRDGGGRFVAETARFVRETQSGDVIGWLQHPMPDPMDWRFVVWSGESHLFRGRDSTLSACGAVSFADVRKPKISGRVNRCASCAWSTRKGHVAVIVAVDDDSITTVGWGEGPKPGRVMKQRLWRDSGHQCGACSGAGIVERIDDGMIRDCVCDTCKGRKVVARSSTVLWRRPGGLYGIARPVAR
jgi:hypothetical protein